MGWRSIHWNYNREWKQETRFERYADDSWMLLIAIGRAWVAFKGVTPPKVRRLKLPKGTRVVDCTEADCTATLATDQEDLRLEHHDDGSHSVVYPKSNDSEAP